MFLFCMLVGIVLGFVVVFANDSDSYLKLLNSENKSLYSYITGTAETGAIFWRTFMTFAIPFALIFVLNLNFYTGLTSYVFITYQSALLIMSCASVAGTYGVSGIINIVFVMLPVNLLYFCVMAFFAVTCISRSKLSHKTRTFKIGFDGVFFLKIALGFAAVLLVTIIACLLYPLFLKNSIFMIF